MSLSNSGPAVSVIGLGSWGTALAQHLAKKGERVAGWSANEEIVRTIRETRVNPRYLPNAPLSENLVPTLDIADALQAPIILVALPASALHTLAPMVRELKDRILVSVTKGLEPSTRMSPVDFLSSILDPSNSTAVLSGPSFAKDVVVGRPCGLVAASTNETAAKAVARIVSSDQVRVYMSDDVIGVEFGGICKNVIALAAGVIDGLELGDSARAGLITRGLAEMMRLAEAVGANPLTLCGLSGLGDLVMTCNSDSSRNRMVGLRLGRGERLAEILKTLGSVAEGVHTAPLLTELAKTHNVEVPISEKVLDLLQDRTSAAEMVRTLLTRPMKREFE